MSFLSQIVNIFFADIWTTFFSLLIGFIVYKLSKFYLKVYSLPPGPIPLPLVGNILLFRSKSHWDEVLKETSRKYGPVFTFWFGNSPNVFITDIDIGREAFRKNDFAGRPDSYFGKMLSNEEYQDVVFTDYGHTWEALRRLTHSAVQKYSSNDKLVYLACDCVDNTLKTIIKKEGLNKEFSPIEYIYLLFLNILANSAFGKSYSVEDKDFKTITYALRDFGREVGSRFLLWEFSPIFRLLDRKMVKKHRKIFNDLIVMANNHFKEHYKDYDQSIERDFCDALISAKNDALREGKESAPYLRDVNLCMAIFDLFFAGTDTSQNTFQWILLFLTYYPEMQTKLRKEIENEIGDRIPTHEDRNRCHYVMAFISETLRLRNVAPTGVPHAAVVTSKIGDFTIPKGNGVWVHQGMILTTEKNWSNAKEFRPERFLENGKYMTTRPKAFIPFGVGRRVCLGEKMALADLFLVLVRFLQSTFNYELILGANGGIEPDPNITDSMSPYDYKIILKSI